MSIMLKLGKPEEAGSEESKKRAEDGAPKNSIYLKQGSPTPGLGPVPVCGP